jgi:Ni/Co efflux regulator RcnB
MKTLLIASALAGFAFVSAPAAAASDSMVPHAAQLTTSEFGSVFEGMRRHHNPHGHVIGGGHHINRHVGHHRWGHRINGRWFAGYHAPGGWMGYRSPVRGFILPSYWINPTYSISNYRLYGLYAPASGYGWSRYYDDAVLRDARGYVQDYRTNIDWGRYEGGYAPENNGYRQPEYGPAIAPDRQVYGVNNGYSAPAYGDDFDEADVAYQSGTGAPYAASGAYYPQQPEQNYGSGPAYAPAAPQYSVPYGYERYERCLKSRGIGGGAIGAIVGAAAGNRIAGRGDRLAGSLIGGGLGALAGVGIEKAANKCRKYLPRETGYQTPAPYPAPSPYPAQQNYPAPAPSYYPAPAPQAAPYPPQGYYYYYPQQAAPTVTTITVNPGVTTSTTTTVTEEVYYETVKARRPARVYRPRPKPRPKPRCVCR